MCSTSALINWHLLYLFLSVAAQEDELNINQELIIWKNKAKILQDRVEQLENDKKFLEQQLAEITIETEGR